MIQIGERKKMSKTIRMTISFEMDVETAVDVFDENPKTKKEWVTFLQTTSQDQFMNDLSDPVIQVVDWTEGTTTNVGSIGDAVDEAGWMKE